MHVGDGADGAPAFASLPESIGDRRLHGLLVRPQSGDAIDWWAALPDKSCRQTVKTYYGERPLHELLERCAWHSAQHARQIIAVLERLGIKPDGPLTDADYAGLPMPKGLWE